MSMIRVVGGVILMRIGFELFAPSSSGGMIPHGNNQGQDVSFIPMAMPIMFGPGAIATVMGLTSTIKESERMLLSFLVVALAIIATMTVTCLSLIYSKKARSTLRSMRILIQITEHLKNKSSRYLM